MAVGVWHVFSTREEGELGAPWPKVKRLPKGAVRSADGNWAELRDDEGVAKVFVLVVDPREER